MATLDDIGGVGSLFGLTPSSINAQREQQYMDFASKVANAEALRPGTGSVLGANVMGARGVQQLGSMFGIESPEDKLAKLRQQAMQQFDVNTPQGLAQAAQFLNQNGDAVGARQAVMAAQAQQQQVANLQKTQAQTQQAEAGKVIQVDLGDRIQLVNALTREVIREIPKGLTPAQAAKARAGDGTGSGDGISGNLGPLTPAQKAVDTKFSKEYTDFFAGGGINSLEKNVEELGRAIDIIDKSKEGDTSGKLIGLADQSGTLGYVSPLAADVKDIIGGVAQSNLRQILGGQFAAKEGEQLLQRQYDTKQTKENNLKRLRALYKQASDTVNTKKAAAEYYEQFGTLKGFKGTEANAKGETPPPTVDKNQEALDWIKANPTDPRVPAIKKKLGIQ